MKKNIMFAILFALSLFSISSFAQMMNDGQMMNGNMNQQRIQMHEYMLKMQQQAIDCLKSGKSEHQCQQQYRKNMQNMHNQYWQNNNDNYWDYNWDNNNQKWNHGCCNMMW